MALKLPDNLMNRPMTPGGLSDGTENIARQFGNRVEQAAGAPSAPSGWGGVANQAAGMEKQAWGQALQTVSKSVQDSVGYIEDIKLADEDSRQKSMFYKIGAQTEELRKNLRADPNLSKQSEDVQQAAYEIQRDTMIDNIVQSESFSNRQIQKLVADNVTSFRATDTSDYNNKILIPSMVQARKQRDGEDVASIVGAAQIAQSPETAAKAAALITDRYTSPDAAATYGAVNAEGMRLNAMRVLHEGLITSALKTADDEFAGAPSKLGMTGLVLGEALKTGPIANMIKDRVAKLDNILIAAGASEGERFIARENYQKTAEMNARAAVQTHNEAVKVQLKEENELKLSYVTKLGDGLFSAAGDGKLTSTMVTTSVNNTLRMLGIDPVAAASNTLTDPAQVKLHHAIITQVTKAENQQKTVRREQARDARQIESLRLQHEMMIMPSTQKGADLSFSDFAKQTGLKDKPVIAYTAEDWTKFNAHVQRTSPTHLPKSVDQAITYGLNSQDPAQVKAGMTAYINLQRVAPGLAAQVDVRTREIAARLAEGADTKGAKAAVDADALRTPEQRKAVETIASKTIDAWKRTSMHPVAQAMGVKSLQPAVLALANREYTDAIARGESPAVAKQTMLAKVKSTAGKTTLMSGDGTEQMAVNAPEVRFNVGVEQGPGWFGKMFGARDNPKVVSNEALIKDLDAALAANGYPEGTKRFVGQPIERGGKPYYPVLITNPDGTPGGPAMDKSGSPLLWTFDPENNPVMNARREKIAKYDADAAVEKQNQAIEYEFQTLVAEAKRQGRNSKDRGGKRDDYADLREQARIKVTGK